MRKLKKLLSCSMYTTSGIALRVIYRIWARMEQKRKEDPAYRATYYDHIHNE